MTTTTPEATTTARASTDVAAVFDNCSKRYGRRQVPALQGLSFCARRGRVTALLGPNGSGKSTAFRSATGQLRLDDGAIEVLGVDVRRSYWKVADQVGVVPDNPTYFRHYDLRTTLRLLAPLAGVARERVDEVLADVGLGDAATKKVGQLSLGMRQRLALAAAMLKRPQLLVLDEPANGLDPQGTVQLRAFLRRFVDTGGSVLLSSHLLGEVEQLADDVVVVTRGHVVESGPLRQFLDADTGYSVRVDGPIESALTVLRHGGIGATCHDGPVGPELFVAGPTPPEVISATLGEAGLWITHLVAGERPLEARYLELVRATESAPWGR